MPKANLSNVFCANAGCEVGKNRTDWWCTTTTGFVLECRSTGGKTYYLRYQDIAGRQRQYKIGRYEDVSFSAARKKAIQLRSEVVMGGDPGAKKAEARTIGLYGDIAAQHIAYARLHLRAHDAVEMVQRVHLIPKWGKMRVNEVTRSAVAQWLAEKQAEGLAPASVLKIRMMLGRAYSLASQAGVPGCDKNPARGLPTKPLNNARNVFLSSEDGVRLKLAVAASDNTQLEAIVRLLLLTGARLRELLDAKWSDVHVDRQSWHIPDTKSGKARWVPLSITAVDIIQSLPRFKGCPFLIPNPKTLKPYCSIKHSWNTATKRAKLTGLRLHDLRHSAASYMVNGGVSLFTVGKVLGHSSYQSTQRYAHLAADTLLAAVEVGAAKQAG